MAFFYTINIKFIISKCFISFLGQVTSRKFLQSQDIVTKKNCTKPAFTRICFMGILKYYSDEQPMI